MARPRKVTSSDEVQDYLEYLVHDNNVRSFRELNRDEQTKLYFLLLVESNQLVTLLREAASLIKGEVGRYDRLTKMSA